MKINPVLFGRKYNFLIWIDIQESIRSRMFSLKLQDSLIICALAGYFTTHLTLMLTRVKSRLILAADYGRVWWELPDLPVASRPPVSGCNKSKLGCKVLVSLQTIEATSKARACSYKPSKTIHDLTKISDVFDLGI